MTFPLPLSHTMMTTAWGSMCLASTPQAIAGLWFEGQTHFPQDLPSVRSERVPFQEALEAQLQAYFQGQRQTFELPLQPLGGTAFQQRVWRALSELPYGHTCTYQALADRLGQPRATRAVASAIARNPLILLIPCHRVIGADGSLRGFAAGVEVKRRLLALEKNASSLFNEEALTRLS